MKHKNDKIDLHLHTSFPGGPERLRGGTWPVPEEVRESYDRYGISFGVLQSLASAEHSHDPITSRMAIALTEQYPQTVGGWFCYLDPRMMNNSSNADLSYYLDFYRERGARGVGELQTNLPITDPRMLSFFRSCEKSSMPVLIHFTIFGGYGVKDEIGLPGLEEILQRFPKLQIIGHASAFWAHISADTLDMTTDNNQHTGKVIPGRLEELLSRYPNLYADLSAGSGYTALTRDPEYSCQLLNRFPNRFYFGTDISSPVTLYMAPERLCAFLDGYAEEGLIRNDTYDAICRENAEVLLRGQHLC